jgi:hypothetical protein
MAQGKSQGGRFFTWLTIGVIFAGGLLAMGVPLWNVYQSIDPNEQRELFYQDEIVYVGTRKVLFWLMVSLAGPVAVGLLYLISLLRKKRFCRTSTSPDRSQRRGWIARLALQIFVAAAGAAILYGLFGKIDLTWAQRQAGGWIDVHQLGVLLLGPMIGPLVLIAVMFLTVILLIAWNLSDSPMPAGTKKLSCDPTRLNWATALMWIGGLTYLIYFSQKGVGGISGQAAAIVLAVLAGLEFCVVISLGQINKDE